MALGAYIFREDFNQQDHFPEEFCFKRKITKNKCISELAVEKVF